MKNWDSEDVSRESEGFIGSFLTFAIKGGVFLFCLFIVIRGFNYIIDPNVGEAERLAENGMRLGVAIAKIIAIGLFLFVIYNAFITPPPAAKKYSQWEDDEI